MCILLVGDNNLIGEVTGEILERLVGDVLVVEVPPHVCLHPVVAVLLG